jgi:endogenous inhibitor of DNA gyrase (YacG/DUF329 family)
MSKPWREKGTLQRLYYDEGLLQGEIAEKLGCNRGTVSRWMNKHEIGPGHGVRLQKDRVTVQCSNCGETLQRMPHRLENRTDQFCDKECHDEFQDEKVALECDQCGETFKKTQSEADRSENDFCSHKCQGDYWGDGNHPRLNRVEVECGQCGDTIEKKRCHVDKYENLFCNTRCYGEWCSENRIGKDSPVWKGGPATYGKGWNDQKREKIRESQDRQCEGCGIHEDDIDTKLCVHHIKPARSFNDADERNDPDNLVALCRPCHWKWEAISPLRPLVVE